MLDRLNSISDEVSRKKLMQGIAGMTLGLGTGASLPFANAAKTTSKGKKVVRIFVFSGMSHLDSFDPKPDNAEVRGDTKVIRTNTGEQISEHFPELAKQMDKIAMVRGMESAEGDHQRGQYLMETSYNMIGTIRHPFFGSWMQALNGKMNDALPPSVAIKGGGAGGGYLGTKYDPFVVKDPKDALKGLIMDDPQSDKSIELLKLMAEVRTDFHKKYKFKNIEAYRKYYNDSIRLMQSDDLSAFNLELEEKAARDKYNITHGDSFLLARRLLEADVQYVSVNVRGGWDHHKNLFDTANYPSLAKDLDKALATFLDDLYERGLLEDTIVTFNTEFGRTPKINRDNGRDHHRKSFCGFMAGAGVKGGIIYGKSDERGEKSVENTSSPATFNATLAALAGIDQHKEIYSPDNRPFTVARGAQVIKGLMA